MMIALLAALALQDGKVKVFILAGQSNMEGKGQMKLAEFQSESPEFRDFYKHLKKDGRWVLRDDVWIDYLGRVRTFCRIGRAFGEAMLELRKVK